MKKFLYILIGLAVCSCSRLSLPDNWREINNASLENTNFKMIAGAVDTAQKWNVAREYGYVDSISITWTADTNAVATNAMTKATDESFYVPSLAIEADCYRASSAFTVTLENVAGSATYTLGVYYTSVHGEHVEQVLWSNFRGDWTMYLRPALHIPVNISLYRDPAVFGFFLEATQGGVTKKFYSQRSKNGSDTKAHNKFFHGIDGYYIYFEDGFGTHNYQDIKIKLTDALVTAVPIQPLDYDQGPWMVICEDLGSMADNDFNDVVFIVHRIDETHIQIEWVAAGATRRNYIYFNNDELGEIHSLLGVKNVEKLINTSSEVKEYGEDFDRPEIRMERTWSEEIEVPKSFTMSAENMGGFAIYSEQLGSIMYVRSNPGMAPYIMVVPGDFFWTQETYSIFDAYPKFINWVKDHTVDTNWYTYHPDKTKIYIEPVD